MLQHFAFKLILITVLIVGDILQKSGCFLMIVSIVLLICYLCVYQAKAFVKDPSKFAAAAATPAVEAAPVEQKEEKKVEESESEDEDMGFGLFD